MEQEHKQEAKGDEEDNDEEGEEQEHNQEAKGDEEENDEEGEEQEHNQEAKGDEVDEEGEEDNKDEEGGDSSDDFAETQMLTQSQRTSAKKTRTAPKRALANLSSSLSQSQEPLSAKRQRKTPEVLTLHQTTPPKTTKTRPRGSRNRR